MKTQFTVDSPSSAPIVIKTSGEYRVELTKPGAHARIVGLFRTNGSELVDVNLTIIHKAAHTKAHTVLKGAADGQSKIRFFGRIIIEPECADTQSFLEERILLLSDQAKAEAVPELEILTDDVKCSHAASISPIPTDQLFYLQSRGISKKDAQEMIVDGFLRL